MSELKPCPFCGMDVACLSDTVELGSADGTAFAYTVVCNAHDGGCGSTAGYDPDYRQAKELWNRRTPQPVTPAGGEVEPVAYRVTSSRSGDKFLTDHHLYAQQKRDAGHKVEPLYTHPPAADAALMRDAERYLWLRDECPEAFAMTLVMRREPEEWAAEIDRVIDAALNQRGGV